MALINEAECNALLKEKINYCMENDIRICISIECALISLLHTIYIEEFKVNNDYIFVAADNFEFTIPFDNETQVTYDEEQNCFIFKHKESDQNNQTEIALFIME